MKFKNLLVGTLATIALTAGLGLSAAPASATELAADSALTVAAPEELSPEVIAAAHKELVDADFPVETSIQDGLLVEAFDLGEGRVLTFTSPLIQPRLGGGFDGTYGLYVDLNQWDQAAILGGGAAALTVAMCALPGVGIPLCAVATGIVTAASIALSNHGLCGNNKQLRIWVQNLGRPECV